MPPSDLTRTRRGLVLALYGNLILVLGLVFFLLSRRASGIVIALFLAGLVALPSLALVRRGRSGFGPLHARFVRAGLFLFVLGALCYFLALLALSTTFLERGQLATLRIALFLLGVGVAAESLSGLAFQWNLVASRDRAWLGAQLALLALLLILVLAHGLFVVNDFVRRSGGIAVNPAEAASYLHDYLAIVGVEFAGLFLVTRAPGLVALWRTIQGLAIREAEEESAFAVAAQPTEAENS